MTLILTIEIHVLQKRAYLTYSAIKVVYTAFTDMHYPLTDIQADFELNRPLGNELPRKEIISTDGRTDRRTDGQTDGQTSRTTTIGSFFEKRKNY